jgi:predicted PurR-regulated permease PerM
MKAAMSAAPDQPKPPTVEDSARWFRRTLAVMGAVALALVAWHLANLMLVLFAAALLGLMLSDFTGLLQRWLRLPFALALAAAILIPLVALIIIFGLFGTMMVEQFISLAEQFPIALQTVQQWARTTPIGRAALAQIDGYAPSMTMVAGMVQSALANVGSAITGFAIVLVAALYMAAQPRLYIDGVIAMLPEAVQSRAIETVQVARDSLTAWLKGQAIGMAFVAVGTSAGLWLVGLPSPLAIGLVAGLCEFVPYLGVVLVSVPTIILGFGQSVESGVFTIIVLAVVQQLQGNVVMPIAQSRFGDLPPVLTIFSLIAAGTLMGPLGVVLAVPLTVVGLALLKLRLARQGRSSPLVDI